MNLFTKPGFEVSLYKNIGDAKIAPRSEEHTSELQSQFRISYAVFCLKKKTKQKKIKKKTKITIIKDITKIMEEYHLTINKSEAVSIVGDCEYNMVYR